jgi:hypothetical protein
MDINQDLKRDFKNWLVELTKISNDHDIKVAQLEKEIKVLRVRNRILDRTAIVLEHSENTKADYLRSENESNLKIIKSKEIELENLEENEWKKIYQIRKLISSLENEISKIEASD